VEQRDPRELLALLTSKVQQFAVADGGIPAYTASDVAYILAHVDDPMARLYARIKFAGEKQHSEELAESMRISLLYLDGIGKWRVPRPDWILEMCRLALWEDIDPHVCGTCQGRGSALIEHKLVTCQPCGGSGKVSLRDTDRSRMLNISKSSWSEPWRSRYRRIQSHTLDRWWRIIGAEISRQKRVVHF
jgi:hypothetical protein